MATPQRKHYRKPGWFTRQIFNRGVSWLTGFGFSIMGSRVLAVRGRKSGEWRTTPVNLLNLAGQYYLVAPRGETQWVRNLRVTLNGELRLGSRSEAFTAKEITDNSKPEILRQYLKRWKFEVGVFFDNVGPDSPEKELSRIAPDHPIFLLTMTPYDR